MEYKLVNVTGVRDADFTAELIVPAEDDWFGGVVGVFEDSDEGNLAPGVSLYNVKASQVTETGETIYRDGLDAVSGEPRYTPQLV